MDTNNLTIISGGQTGVDRAALDFALSNNIVCDGYCPKGRLAEDGVIPAFYPLKETLTSDYKERTRKNVEDSDGTLIMYLTKPDDGTRFTITCCLNSNKPYFVLCLHVIKTDKIWAWIEINKIKTLNIGGSRESSEPGIYKMAKHALDMIYFSDKRLT